MKNSSLGTKLFMIILSLTVLVYFGAQAYQYYNDPLTTTLAYLYQVEEASSLSGYVVRDERVLPDESGGMLRFQREEGERVGVGGTIAAVYADQASLDLKAEIETLDERIEQLTYAYEAALGVEVAQKLDAQIRQSILEYQASLAAERLNDAEKQGAELRSQVMKRDYTGSNAEELALLVEELRAQRKSLQSQSAASVQRITAPEAGLYSGVVDGYETVLTPESLEALTPSALTGLQADPAVQSNVGKLILGKEWYYAAAMPAEEAALLQKEETQGQTLMLRFAKGVERDLPVTVDSVSAEEAGRVVMVFRGDTYLPQLTLLRQQSAKVIYRERQGIRVPREALRIVTEAVTDENGEERQMQTTGVYCMIGIEARFKPVEILYSSETFALVQPAASVSKETLRLRPGDEVIVLARSLHDGKIVG